MLREKQWQRQVYKAQVNDCSLDKEAWKELREKVFKSDSYTCQACGSKNNLTAHHIIPRSQGGPDDKNNLITLCHSCHDKIEIAISEGQWLYSRCTIMGYFEPCEDYNREEAPDWDEWHLWVYGAYRRPSCKKHKQEH